MGNLGDSIGAALMQVKCMLSGAGHTAAIMRLTKFSDYALRTLMYLATRAGQRVTIEEISKRHRISRNHLMKIVSMLAQAGFVSAIRGKGGGLALTKPPGEISVGSVVRMTEAGSMLVECADRTTNTCTIVRTCALKQELFAAHEVFYQRLDSVSLEAICRSAPLPKVGSP
jgi:Rrf2 family transcriptional regulator, nitric oxide-sensitive transcriptional repressor